MEQPKPVFFEDLDPSVQQVIVDLFVSIIKEKSRSQEPSKNTFAISSRTLNVGLQHPTEQKCASVKTLHRSTDECV